MKKKHLVAFVICFSFLFCFLCVGYAALTDTLTINGMSTVSAQDGVFISDVTADNNATVNKYLSTTLNISLNFANTNTSTATITVYNNSSYEYVFNGVVYDNTIEDNAYIDYTLGGIVKGDTIAANEELTFTVTYSPKSTATDTSLTSIFNYQFVLDSEYIPEVAASGATARFEEILNSETEFKSLTDKMDTVVDGRNDSSYIGNVVGSVSTDSTAINDLFTTNGSNALVLDINGVQTNVTAMIKRANVDGDTSTGDESGNEMTIYMTAEDPTEAGGSLFNPGEVQVFVAVFTKNGDGDWYQLGEMYEGEATVNNYAGNIFGTRNSFNTDTWISTQSYYGLNTGADIEAIITAYKGQQ